MIKRITVLLFLIYQISYSGYNINPKELTKEIFRINKVLENEKYNNLVAGTIGVETLYGKYRGKSKLGITQISKAGWGYIKWKITYEDIDKIKLLGYDHSKIKFENICNDITLSIAYCSLYYKYKLENQNPSTIKECAVAWKKYYNTKEGKGTVNDYLMKYDKHVKMYL